MDRLEQIKNTVTANGMREWTDESVSQAMREYSDQQNVELRERVEELDAQVSDLTEIINGINGCRKISLPWPDKLENRVNKLWEEL